MFSALRCDKSQIQVKAIKSYIFYLTIIFNMQRQDRETLKRRGLTMVTAGVVTSRHATPGWPLLESWAIRVKQGMELCVCEIYLFSCSYMWV